MANTFDQHNFAFKWTHGEFEGARELYPWCLDQLLSAYQELAELMRPADEGPLSVPLAWVTPSPVTVTCENAADLEQFRAGSVTLVAMDPPYYDNVMYAELSDFFYVWEKRTLGLIQPALFRAELTDKKGEAVANVARFEDAGQAQEGARRRGLRGQDGCDLRRVSQGPP